MAHLPVQIGLTLVWHGMELGAIPSQKKMRFLEINRLTQHEMAKTPIQAAHQVDLWGGIFCLFAILLGLSAQEISKGDCSHFSEISYRSFLLLYATILPAYVLLKMIPTLRPTGERFRTIVFLIASLISYPLGWGAFVLFRHWLIIPCALVLTLAFLAVQFGPKAKDDSESPAFKPKA